VHVGAGNSLCAACARVHRAQASASLGLSTPKLQDPLTLPVVHLEELTNQTTRALDYYQLKALQMSTGPAS